MKWFKSKKQKRIEELEAELAKIKELAYSNMPRIIDKLNETNDKIDNLKFVSPYRVEREKTETLCAKFAIPDGYSMREEDINERLAAELVKGVSQYMITYNRYEPRTMEHEFMAYVKVIVCPDRTFYDNKMIY
ncbi:MAG: hypothetical protein J6U54_17755 [Clostridiales bacterium]|nr:hypothetical protein [Clostridiales bacterium]